MKDNKDYYVVRGTGTSLDGTVVSLEGEGEDGYIFILPYGRGEKNPFKSIRIHKNYLQEIKEKEKFHYSITIAKYDEGGVVVDKKWLNIKDTFKNVKCDAIKTFIEMNIKPLLETE